MDSFLFLGVLMSLLITSNGYDFFVGGKDGWVVNPTESHGQWAGRNRFQVNDTLGMFRYKKGDDSVLVVNKRDYDSCNVSNPIKRFDDGNSVFKFDRSGPFFFTSGASGRCQQGEKLVVVVLAVRNKKASPPPTPSTFPSLPPPISPSPKPSTSPSPSPSSSAPSPSPSSVSSPSPSPVASGVSPTASPPTTETSTATGNTPAVSPTSSPSSSAALAVPEVSLGLVAMVLGAFLG